MDFYMYVNIDLLLVSNFDIITILTFFFPNNIILMSFRCTAVVSNYAFYIMQRPISIFSIIPNPIVL